jgi:cysteine desulfurase
MKAFLDNSATTMVDPEVVREMLPFFTERYGNPSSIHSFGEEAREAVENARGRVARLVGAKPSEITFTSGGTESDNLAIRGCALARGKEGKSVACSAIEHPAILETCGALKRFGFGHSLLGVDRSGFLRMEDAERAIGGDTAVASVMLANNEIGTIQPVRELSEVCARLDVPLHTDAVQAAGKIRVDVDALGVSMASIASHKMHGPKGVGALFVREGLRLAPEMTGGGQEAGRRSGTENVPGIVGFGKAAELASARLGEDAGRMQTMRDKLISGLTALEETYLNGSHANRLPNNANLRFHGVEGEALVMLLDEKGIAGSTGSACSSKKLKASHVLTAIGLKDWQAHGSLRLTLSRFTREEEIALALEETPKAVETLRRMSPVWRKMKAREPVAE